MFICNHCPYVKAIIKELSSTVSSLKKYNVNSVAIMSNDTVNYPDDSFDNMKKFAQENNFSFPYLFDETQEIAKIWELYVLLTFLDIILIMNSNIVVG